MMSTKNLMSDCVIIGGGAAGLLAAATASERGRSVIILEPMERPGRKLRITGKGRCNVTNACEDRQFFSSVCTNPKFLRSAYYAFPPNAVMEYFESLGVPLKTERGGRVFPISDRAEDIVDALVRNCRRLNVKIIRDRAQSITFSSGMISGVQGNNSFYPCHSVLIATGGLSYPATGSTGDGFDIANSLGHRIVPLRPSLVPFETDDFCPMAQGLSLRNVTLSLYDGNKKVYSDLGEILFTHFGISGPLALTASTYIKTSPDKYKMELDLKPALSEEKLDERILRDFSENSNRDFRNSLDQLLPQKLIPIIINLSGINEHTKVNSVTRAQRLNLVHILKHFQIHATAFRPWSEAIITSGGVDVNEINPRSMESKIIPGLFFAGEVIDCDAVTGGFNLQIAWSTAHLAGEKMG